MVGTYLGRSYSRTHKRLRHSTSSTASFFFPSTLLNITTKSVRHSLLKIPMNKREDYAEVAHLRRIRERGSLEGRSGENLQTARGICGGGYDLCVWLKVVPGF